MLIITASSDKPDKATPEMKDWFDRRTKHHIQLVQKYCKKIEKYDSERFKGLAERGKKHDQSKFEAPEYDPYLFVAWKHRCKSRGQKFDVDEATEESMAKATEHHVKNNPHHPEYHTDQKGDLTNHENRDKPPDKVIDATKMGNMDIAEMIADWCSMGEELGTQPKEWADKNVNVRWKFTDEQKDLIYELIEEIF